ncbi:MAG: hypothetical protein L0241_01765 [Planctomycetia bacterium]|nr:hypothetical protein [Planctomycetia bacterium]
MATIRVYKDEAHGDLFPRVCMRCGQLANHDVPQNFAWMPPWVHILLFAGLAPWLIVALILRKTMRVTAPMCDRHRGHWRIRKLYIGLGLLFWIALAIGLIAFSDQLPEDAVMPAFAFGIFGSLFWLVVGLFLVNGSIRATEITENRIELSNVHKAFAQAWREILDEEREQRPVARRPRR